MRAASTTWVDVASSSRPATWVWAVSANRTSVYLPCSVVVTSRRGRDEGWCVSLYRS